jgi:MFS family permease
MYRPPPVVQRLAGRHSGTSGRADGPPAKARRKRVASLTSNDTAADEVSIRYPSAFVRWYTVGVLCVLAFVSLLDRQILALLIQPIRQDLGLSDSEIGLVGGIAFSLFYTFGGLPIGWLVDRYSRRWVVYLGVTFWSIATAACGLARSFLQLFLARMSVGVGEASLHISAYSIMGDLFPKDRLTAAITTYHLGASTGNAFAFVIGGLVVGFVSDGGVAGIPLLNTLRPWQVAFMAVGLPGLLVALLMLTTPEAPRHRATSAGPASSSFAAVLPFWRRHLRFLLCHHIGFALISVMTIGMVFWSPSYLLRSFNWSTQEVGSAIGAAHLAGLIGLLASGPLVDAWYRRGRKEAHLLWSMMTLAVGTACLIGGILLHTPWAFLGAVAVYQVLIGSVFPAIAAAQLQLVAPSELRGRMGAIYMLGMSFLGSALGPQVVAFFTDFVFHDDTRVGSSIVATLAIFTPAVLLLFALGLGPLRRAVDEAEAHTAQ